MDVCAGTGRPYQSAARARATEGLLGKGLMEVLANGRALGGLGAAGASGATTGYMSRLGRVDAQLVVVAQRPAGVEAQAPGLSAEMGQLAGGPGERRRCPRQRRAWVGSGVENPRLLQQTRRRHEGVCLGSQEANKTCRGCGERSLECVFRIFLWGILFSFPKRIFLLQKNKLQKSFFLQKGSQRAAKGIEEITSFTRRK